MQQPDDAKGVPVVVDGREVTGGPDLHHVGDPRAGPARQPHAHADVALPRRHAWPQPGCLRLEMKLTSQDMSSAQ